MHEAAAQVVGLVRGAGLPVSRGDAVDHGDGRDVLAGAQGADVDRSRDPPVVPLLDRPHALGAHHLQQSCIHELVHVVGDRALRPTHGLGHLGHGRGALEEQLEQRAPQVVCQSAELYGGGDHDQLVEIVVGDLLLIDRHIWNILG
jgi:hypothetical protein